MYTDYKQMTGLGLNPGPVTVQTSTINKATRVDLDNNNCTYFNGSFQDNFGKPAPRCQNVKPSWILLQQHG